MEEYIYRLVRYGLQKGLIDPLDITYTINSLAASLGVEELTGRFEEASETDSLPEILSGICDEAFSRGRIPDNGVTERDLLDTKIMGLLTPKPSEVVRRFSERKAESPEAATDYFYKLSGDVNYIRRDRVKKDEKWVTETPYGPIDITINLSKPEKDPRAIAEAGKRGKSGYPACLLCRENEGYAGHISHPARQNLRLIPLMLAGEEYDLQYSPYVYYNEHCIVLSKEHRPMKIDRAVFDKLLSFTEQFPHYMIGSNADLPIVGGSILSHDHFQGGRYTFAMEKAEMERQVTIPGYEDVRAGIVRWPMSVIRLQAEKRERAAACAEHILQAWRNYSDESLDILAHTAEPHNTITPIARRRGELFELDLVLRNNRTDAAHPYGIFHPTEDLHHIKKENIGLIEVMGLAVLPARLKKELERLEEIILAGGNLREDPLTEKHADWAEAWLEKYPTPGPETLRQRIRDEVGFVFAKVLECAGVYKRTPEGQAGFDRFLRSL